MEKRVGRTGHVTTLGRIWRCNWIYRLHEPIGGVWEHEYHTGMVIFAWAGGFFLLLLMGECSLVMLRGRRGLKREMEGG